MAASHNNMIQRRRGMEWQKAWVAHTADEEHGDRAQDVRSKHREIARVVRGQSVYRCLPAINPSLI